MNLAAVSAVAVTMLAVAAPAAAQAPGDTPPTGAPGASVDPYRLAPSYARPAEQVVTVTHTYRGHVLLSDLAAFGVAAGLQSEHGAQLGALIYVAGPAAVHVAHGNSRAAWKSVGLRLGLPALGAMAGVAVMAAADCEGIFCAPIGIVYGGGLGMASAMIVDWAFLAKKTEPRRPGAGWVPTAAVTPDGSVAFGAVGRF
jgi:hypothetical protein